MSTLPASSNAPRAWDALLTDLCELTMACGYWKSGTAAKEAVFLLFFRTSPFQNGFTIACGLAAAIEWLHGFRFGESDLAYLTTLAGQDHQPLFDPDFLDYLGNLRMARVRFVAGTSGRPDPWDARKPLCCGSGVRVPDSAKETPLPGSEG
jgi:nicotinic acid phosphoribosyltransferase